MKKRSIHFRILFITAAILIFINAAAWIAPLIESRFNLPNICDKYTLFVTPIWVNLLGRLNGLFSFSVGEIMLIIAVFLVAVLVIITVLRVFLHKNKFVIKLFRTYGLVCLYITAYVGSLMTLNCTMLYHCAPCMPEARSYNVRELGILRNDLVMKCNYYSTIMERDDEGHIISDVDMMKEAKEDLHRLSSRYPKLAGWYPDVKTLRLSHLMSQMYMCGYYFPFSMEANCNGDMYITNYPATYCHELSHLHGYIYEDEANFIAYLACQESDSDFIRYCGCLSVLGYVNNAYYESLGEEGRSLFNSVCSISPQVIEDDAFLLEETWEEVEQSAVISTETVKQASETFTDTSLKLNGVEEGMAAYSGVVELLLQYYDELGAY